MPIRQRWECLEKYSDLIAAKLGTGKDSASTIYPVVSRCTSRQKPGSIEIDIATMSRNFLG